MKTVKSGTKHGPGAGSPQEPQQAQSCQVKKQDAQLHLHFGWTVTMRDDIFSQINLTWYHFAEGAPGSSLVEDRLGEEWVWGAERNHSTPASLSPYLEV